MNEIAVHTGSALAVSPEQDFWTPKQESALAQIGVEKASKADLAVFFHQCQRTGLDPFARQIYMIERKGKQTIQTGIDGFRLIARRATDAARGTFGYEDTLWCGEDGKWTDVWLQREQPRAAKVTVIRDGARYPAIALWNEYVGTKFNGDVTQMWATKGALMLAKCAEALALRKAFPQDLSGLYTSDEMQQEDNGQQGSTRQRPQQSRQRSIAETLGESVTVDVESLISSIEAAESKDVLRELWKETAALVDPVQADVRALIQGRLTDLDTPATPVDAAEPEQLPLDAEPVDAETVEEQVAS
ncbi:phage recombination protein Bet [Rhodococcus erythropolis]|uniref:phage recombination protein Bet n=1 Tax=Rhodococcus erythropolis TaxID=1833 RepID=UPI001C9A7F93|nr:phage recombination protein Bet [Rhodococcus erythropolis]MBY6385500.1 phage recombination protein Bet [Rhodococcus erythropolis]